MSVEDKVDIVKMDVPLLVRLLEYASEELQSDVELHKVVENIVARSKASDVLTMADYGALIPKPAVQVEAKRRLVLAEKWGQEAPHSPKDGK